MCVCVCISQSTILVHNTKKDVMTLAAVSAAAAVDRPISTVV